MSEETRFAVGTAESIAGPADGSSNVFGGETLLNFKVVKSTISTRAGG